MRRLFLILMPLSLLTFTLGCATPQAADGETQAAECPATPPCPAGCKKVKSKKAAGKMTCMPMKAKGKK